MLIIFYIIIAKECYQIWIICFVCVQIELGTPLSAFLHSTGHKVFEQSFLICPKLCRQIRIAVKVILIIVNGLILG